MIDYRLAESEADRDAALQLIVESGVGGGDLPGCADAQTANLMAQTMRNRHDQNAYVIAVDEDGVMVAAIAVRYHPDGVHHIAVLAYGKVEERFTRSIYHNMNVALTRVLNWPGCCDNRWVVIQPPHPWLDSLRDVAGTMNVEDSEFPGLLRITGTMDGPRNYGD